MKASAVVKCIFLMATIFGMCHHHAYAQPAWLPGSGNNLWFGGTVGIGTSAPDDALHIHYPGQWPFAVTRYSAVVDFGHPEDECLATARIALAHSTGGFSSIANKGDLVIGTNDFLGDGGICAQDVVLVAKTDEGKLRFATYDNQRSRDVERMRIDHRGRVGIATADPEELVHINVNGTDSRVRIGAMGMDANGAHPDAHLTVDGKIVARELVITESDWGNWPDFVFSSDYELMTLEELERSIKEHKHLPGIPSAAEVQTHGVEFTTMQMAMLRKIEELTLYMIALKKENVELRTLIDTINN